MSGYTCSECDETFPPDASPGKLLEHEEDEHEGRATISGEGDDA